MRRRPRPVRPGRRCRVTSSPARARATAAAAIPAQARSRIWPSAVVVTPSPARGRRPATAAAAAPSWARGLAWRAAGAVTAAVLLVTGCGSPSGPPDSTPGSVPSVTATPPAPPKATCGEARTAANVPVVVEVEKGAVPCAVAMRIQHSYTALVQEGRVRGNGGGAPVTVAGWTCQGETTPVIVQTGEASVCRQGTAEIITVLKLPGGSG